MQKGGNQEISGKEALPITRALLEFLRKDGALAIHKPFGEAYFLPIYEFGEDHAFTFNVTPFEEDKFLLLTDALLFIDDNDLEGEKLLY